MHSVLQLFPLVDVGAAQPQAGPYGHAVAYQHSNEEEPIEAQQHQQTVLALAFVSAPPPK